MNRKKRMNPLLGNKKTRVIIISLAVVLIILVAIIAIRAKKPEKKVVEVAPTPTYSMFVAHDEPQSGVDYEYIEPDQAKKDIAVGSLVRKLPFQGTYATLSYSVKTNKFTAVLSSANKKAADAELAAYLKKNEIADKSWLPDLVIQVK